MQSRRTRSLEQLLEGNYNVDIGYYLNRGLGIFQQDLGPFVGFNLLSGLINAAAASIPGIGSLVNLVISGSMTAGPWIYAFKSCQRKERVFGDFFLGFNYWVALLVTTLLISFFSLVLMLPFLVVGAVQMLRIFAPLIRELDAETVAPEDLNALVFSDNHLWQLLPWILFLSLTIVVVGMGIRLIYIFAFPLILDRKLEFWPAMEVSRRLVSKRWGALLTLLVVLDLINLGGALLLLLGLIFTLPLTNCVLAAAYEDIVGLEAEAY